LVVFWGGIFVAKHLQWADGMVASRGSSGFRVERIVVKLMVEAARGRGTRADKVHRPSPSHRFNQPAHPTAPTHPTNRPTNRPNRQVDAWSVMTYDSDTGSGKPEPNSPLQWLDLNRRALLDLQGEAKKGGCTWF
jgi:hypothetical protein